MEPGALDPEADPTAAAAAAASDEPSELLGVEDRVEMAFRSLFVPFFMAFNGVLIVSIAVFAGFQLFSAGCRAVLLNGVEARGRYYLLRKDIAKIMAAKPRDLQRLRKQEEQVERQRQRQQLRRERLAAAKEGLEASEASEIE